MSRVGVLRRIKFLYNRARFYNRSREHSNTYAFYLYATHIRTIHYFLNVHHSALGLVTRRSLNKANGTSGAREIEFYTAKMIAILFSV